jgi:hypothetical protein
MLRGPREILFRDNKRLDGGKTGILRLGTKPDMVYCLRITARPLASIGDENAACAPAPLEREQRHVSQASFDTV